MYSSIFDAIILPMVNEVRNYYRSTYVSSFLIIYNSVFLNPNMAK